MYSAGGCHQPRAKTVPGSQLEGPGCNKGVSMEAQGKGGNLPKMLGGPRAGLVGSPCPSFLLTALSSLIRSCPRVPAPALPALAQPGAGPEFCGPKPGNCSLRGSTEEGKSRGSSSIPLQTGQES